MLARHGTHGGRLDHLAVANTGSACVSNGRRRTAPAVRARAVPSAARAAARQPASRKQVSQLGARRACRPQRKTTCHTPADSGRTAQIDATHSAAAVRAGDLGRICASRGAAARAPAGGWSSASALGRDAAACWRRCGTRVRGPTRAATMSRSRRSARRTRAAAPRARGKGCTVCREAPAPQLAAAGPAASRPGISRLPHHGWDPGSRGGPQERPASVSTALAAHPSRHARRWLNAQWLSGFHMAVRPTAVTPAPRTRHVASRDLLVGPGGL